MLRVSVAPFAKLDLLPLLEFDELPPHKGVVVRVGISCDERPSPVNLHTPPPPQSVGETLEISKRRV